MGARGRRPLWSPPWVPVTFGHCFLFFLIFYSLFFTALDALPCPALPCPYPALPLPLPYRCPALFRIFLLLPGTGGGSYTGNGKCFFPFAARDRRRKLHREREVFFFLLLPGTGGGSYIGNGQCFFFLLLPGTGGGSYTGNGYLKQDHTYTWWEAFEHMQKLLSRK